MKQQPKFPSGTRVPASQQKEMDAFASTTGQFQSGALSEAQFRAIRVPMGIYEQRESRPYVLRKLDCRPGAFYTW